MSSSLFMNLTRLRQFDQVAMRVPESCVRRHSKSHQSVVIIFIMTIYSLSSHKAPITCVVVDGVKKDEISALAHQKASEEQNIDSFNTHTCGIADPNSEEHEFVNMAREGQFPWYVSFQIKIMSGLSYNNQLEAASQKRHKTRGNLNRHKVEDLHFCSGALISDKWVLSAAHCFVGETLKNYLKNDKLKMVAGSPKVSSRTSLNRNFTIERIYYHSRFEKSMPIGFDVALVELRERAELKSKRDQNKFGEQQGPFMNAICLPKRNNQYKFNESARIAGWGMSKAKDSHTMPSKLLFTDILLANRKNCSEIYAKKLKSDTPQQRDDFICASYRTLRDSCQSDSGGPLMQYVNRKAVAIGIVSYGIACATKGVPGVYTKTSNYIEWIEDITRNGPKAKAEFKLLESVSAKRKTKTTSTTTTSTLKPGSSEKGDKRDDASGERRKRNAN